MGGICAVAVIAILLLVAGVRFERPLSSQGAALYNAANEAVLSGVVQEFQKFPCPVSEGEEGGHLLLKTDESVVRVHLAPGRILRSQNITFAPGDKISVVGAKFRFQGSNDLIAREVTRGNENFIFRDHSGKLMLVQ
jgi:hypothetical protein